MSQSITEQYPIDIDERGQIIYQRTDPQTYYDERGQEERRPEIEERHIRVRYSGRGGSNPIAELILKLRHNGYGSDGLLFFLTSNKEKANAEIDLGNLDSLERLGQALIQWVSIERERQAREEQTRRNLDSRQVQVCVNCGMQFAAWPNEHTCGHCVKRANEREASSEIPF